ncbi:hypothetical protein DSECCO2_555910 [anaerobic digester metagenome]
MNHLDHFLNTILRRQVGFINKTCKGYFYLLAMTQSKESVASSAVGNAPPPAAGGL